VDKRLWTNISLLALIVLLSAVLLIPDNEDEQNLPQLSDSDPTSIVKIEVIRKDLENFVFNKQNNVWRMNSPQQFLANNARINAMLRLLKAESHSQLNPADVDLKRFDLADPIITMKLNGHVLQFGNTDAIDQRRYVLFDGMIHLTNDFLYAQLTTNAAFFAHKKLLPDDFEISTIQFPENKIELLGNQWQMQTLMDINPAQVKRIVFNWNNAIALSVSKYAVPETESSIIVSSTNGDTIVFIIVSVEPHLILGRKDSGIQYHLGSDETDKLLLKEAPETNVSSDKNESE
jgi:Domain of unknown function (DUF4340)